MIERYRFLWDSRCLIHNPDWKAVNVTTGDLDVGADGTVDIKASATGNAKFFRVVTPEK